MTERLHRDQPDYMAWARERYGLEAMINDVLAHRIYDAVHRVDRVGTDAEEIPYDALIADLNDARAALGLAPVPFDRSDESVLSALEDLKRDINLRDKAHIYESLETARRAICRYSQDPCDCKYGRTADTPNPSMSEKSGCPELRDLIEQLTGWSPFNRGQSVADDVRVFTAPPLPEREG